VTRHRSPDERVDEILAAAAEVVEAQGHASLTMDAVARRTTLSKAGIYRFFPNKRAVVHALFRRIYEQFGEVDGDEALSWGLPAGETITRMLAEQNALPETPWLHRVWLQLLPATLHDRELADVRSELLERHVRSIRAVALRVLARDRQTPPPDFEERYARAAVLATCLLEGMAIRGITPDAMAALVPSFHRFMELLTHDVLHG
jgi:AcrR family transcriptional regulator